MTGSPPLRLAEAASLEFNGRGELAPAQRALLARWILADLWRFGLAVLAAAALAFAAVIAAREVYALGASELRLLFVGTVLLGSGAGLSVWGRRAFLVTSDLWRGEVASSWGRLGWSGGRWAVELDTPPLRLIWHPAQRAIEVPPPGRGRVFWLPRSGFVVGLDGEISKGVRSTAEVRDALLERLGVGVPDLEVLRSGRLGDWGRRRLGVMMVWRLAGVIAIVAVLLFDTPRLWAEPMWLLVVLIASGGAIVLLLSRAQRLLEDRREGGVLRVSGPLRVAEGTGLDRWSGSQPVHVMLDRPLLLSIRGRAAAALVADLEYAVYYTPRVQAVLAVEPLDDVC